MPICDSQSFGLDDATFAVGGMLMGVCVVGVVMEELAVGYECFMFVCGIDRVTWEDEAVDHVGGLFDEEEER